MRPSKAREAAGGAGMRRMEEAAPPDFTTPERAFIRQKMSVFYGHVPTLDEGMLLRSWVTGARRGQPKIPPAVRSMLARGLVEVTKGPTGYVAVFTPTGLKALRRVVADGRAMHPGRFAHLRRELGLGPVEQHAPE